MIIKKEGHSMGKQEKSSGIELNTLLKVTEKYYMGSNELNIIIYTKWITKKKEITCGRPMFFPTIKSAINRVMELSEIDLIGTDILEMVEKFEIIKNEIITAMQEIKERGIK